MQILLTRLDNKRHRLEVKRDDGSRDSVELETRSLLLHDLVHYAVEAEAALEEGFWPLLASGRTFAELAPDARKDPPADLMLAETLVGPMQAVWNGRFTAEQYAESFGRKHDFVDAAFVERVSERLRRLWGHWRGTGFHETMEFSWPPEDAP
jgi:hypothetical protein